MGIGLPKLILIIIVSISIIALLVIWIKGTFFKEVSRGLSEEIKVPASERERLIKISFFAHDSKKETSQFVMNLYDENQNEFKIKKDSPTSLEATYYGVEALQNLLGNLNIVTNHEALLDEIRSYYVSSVGYYLEEGKNPIFSTRQALRIDRWFREDLNQKIDLDWLKGNSPENKNLESDKLDPEYQVAVLEIYRHLPIPKAERSEKLEELSYPYFAYYCKFQPAEDISDPQYLREKYYQIVLIAKLSGAEGITSFIGTCFKKSEIEAEKGRLSQINLNNLKDIKEIYWLYFLQKFYNLKPDLEEIFKKVENFYSEGGFKEKLTDKEPNLIGTYYVTLFINK